MTISRDDVITLARSYCESSGRPAVKWRHQGRNREGGVDCLGLPACVAKELGISDYDLTNYGRTPEATRFLAHFHAAGCTRVNPVEAADGDLVIFRQDRYPCHVGILSSKAGVRHIIHASLSHKKVVEEPLPDDRGSPGAPIVAVFRMPGVEA